MEKFHILPKSKIDQLPKTAGVYLFFEKKEPMYIGKAINIKDRVKNHFQQPSYRDNLFIQKVQKIGFINTDSEIEALILEANLIKKHLPKFNVVWRDDKNYFYVAITKDKKPMVFITHQKTNLKTNYVGPFVEGNALKKTLKYLRRIFPYYTTQKHPKNACTWCHLGLCPGPNLNLVEYKKNIKKFALILEGKRKIVLNNLKREMKAFSNMHKFEEAGKIRDHINALQQVMEHAHVIKLEGLTLQDFGGSDPQWLNRQKMLQKILGIKTSISKIECYDISNIQGKHATGSMVVFVNGSPDKSQYKKFKIRMKNEPNDIAMLKEMLTRRLLHPEWGYPEIMLIDGGIAQLNVAIKAKNSSYQKVRDSVISDNTKKEFLKNLTIVKIARKVKNIKVISIAKGKRELLIEGAPKIPLKNLPQEVYNLIKHLDDEAHRFAISYHKLLRSKKIMGRNAIGGVGRIGYPPV